MEIAIMENKEGKMDENKGRNIMRTGRSPFQKLFVGNIPYYFKDKHLRPIFEVYGEIEEIVIMKKDNGRPSGSAFVVMAKEDGAFLALAFLGRKPEIAGREANLEYAYVHAKPPSRDFGIRGDLKDKSPKRIKDHNSLQHPYHVATQNIMAPQKPDVQQSAMTHNQYMVDQNGYMVNQHFVPSINNSGSTVGHYGPIGLAQSEFFVQTLPANMNPTMQSYAAPMYTPCESTPAYNTMVLPANNYEATTLSSTELVTTPQAPHVPLQYYNGAALQYPAQFVDPSHMAGCAVPPAFPPMGCLPTYYQFPPAYYNPGVIPMDSQSCVDGVKAIKP